MCGYNALAQLCESGTTRPHTDIYMQTLYSPSLLQQTAQKTPALMADVAPGGTLRKAETSEAVKYEWRQWKKKNDGVKKKKRGERDIGEWSPGPVIAFFGVEITLFHLHTQLFLFFLFIHLLHLPSTVIFSLSKSIHPPRPSFLSSLVFISFSILSHIAKSGIRVFTDLLCLMSIAVNFLPIFFFFFFLPDIHIRCAFVRMHVQSQNVSLGS